MTAIPTHRRQSTRALARAVRLVLCVSALLLSACVGDTEDATVGVVLRARFGYSDDQMAGLAARIEESLRADGLVVLDTGAARLGRVRPSETSFFQDLPGIAAVTGSSFLLPVSVSLEAGGLRVGAQAVDPWRGVRDEEVIIESLFGVLTDEEIGSLTEQVAEFVRAQRGAGIPAISLERQAGVMQRFIVSVPGELAPGISEAVLNLIPSGSEPVEMSYSESSREDSGELVLSVSVPPDLFASGELIEYRTWAITEDGSRIELRSNEGVQAFINDPVEIAGIRTLHWYPRQSGDLVYESGTLYSGVRTRAVGASAGGWDKHPWKFEFRDAQRFAMGADGYDVGEFRLNSPYADKAYIRQVLSYDTYRLAGVPGPLAVPVVVFRNGHFFGIYILTEMVANRDFLRRHGMCATGLLYKGEEERILPRGDDGSEELDMIEYNETFFLDYVDIPGSINYLAATTLTGGTDQVWGGNIFFYNDPSDGRWTLFPWDTDLTFGRNSINPRVAGVEDYVLNDEVWGDVDYVPDLGRSVYPSHPFVGSRDYVQTDYGWRPFFDTIYTSPGLRELYLVRLRTLMDTILQRPGTPYEELVYEQLIDAYVELLSPVVEADRQRWGWYGEEQTLEEAIGLLEREYLASRRRHLFVNHAAGNPAGWERDNAGIPDALVGSLAPVISEVVHTPRSGRRDQEYIRIENPHDAALDLSGWRLEGSISFEFPPGTVIGTLLDAIYVTPNVQGFLARETSPRGGEGHLVLGNYSRRLPNEGGAVALLDPTGTTRSIVRYAPRPGAFEARNFPAEQ